MPRSTRKKSKTGTCHVMLRVNTESPVHTVHMAENSSLMAEHFCSQGVCPPVLMNYPPKQPSGNDALIISNSSFLPSIFK